MIPLKEYLKTCKPTVAVKVNEMTKKMSDAAGMTIEEMDIHVNVGSESISAISLTLNPHLRPKKMNIVAEFSEE